MRTILFLAIRQLLGRKGLNLLAAGGVLIGVAALLAIQGILGGHQKHFLSTMLRTAPHVVVLDKEIDAGKPIVKGDLVQLRGEPPAVGDGRIRQSDAMTRALRTTDGIEAATGLVVGNVGVVAGAHHVSAELRGIDPATQDAVTPLRPYVVQGEWSAFAASKDGALVGAVLAKQLHVRVGQSLRCEAYGGASIVVRVVGILETGVWSVDKTRILVPLRAAQTVLGRGDTIDRIELRIASPDDADAVAKSVRGRFGYDAESWRDVNASFLQIFKQQSMIGNIVIGALLAVAGCGILSVQVMTVFQKRRDIAILRSVGFKRRDVVFAFLVQGFAVAFVGALLGSGVGHAILAWLRTVPTAGNVVRADTFPILETPSMYLFGAIYAIGIGIAASAFPAWRASRVEPVDVLRGQI